MDRLDSKRMEDTESTEGSRTGGSRVRVGWAPSLRVLRGPRSVHSFYHGGHRGHGGFSNRRFAGSWRLSSVPPCSPWSAQRTFVLPRRAQRTRRVLEPEVRGFASAELRPSVFSVVGAAHIRFTTEGTEDTEESRTGGSRVRVGWAPSLRVLRGPRSVHPFYHGGYSGHGGWGGET